MNLQIYISLKKKETLFNKRRGKKKIEEGKKEIKLFCRLKDLFDTKWKKSMFFREIQL